MEGFNFILRSLNVRDLELGLSISLPLMTAYGLAASKERSGSVTKYLSLGTQLKSQVIRG